MGFLDFVIKGTWKGVSAQFRYDQIIVSVDEQIPGRDIRTVIKKAIGVVPGTDVLSFRPGRRWAIVSIPQGTDPAGSAVSIGKQPGIQYAEPDFLMVGHSLPEPSDSRFSGQKPWVDKMRLREAWMLLLETRRIRIGNDHVLIAVLDSGIQMWGGQEVDHRDFDPGRFIVSHSEDGNPVSHDFWQNADLPIDEHGHGTWITGLIAATPNNDEGIAGINWHSPVFVARVLDDTNHTCVGAVMKAMDVLEQYAQRMGYTRVVVNLSLGSTIDTEVQSLRLMITNVNEEQFLLCCAPKIIDTDPREDFTEYHADYPARYAADHSNVVSVGASDVEDKVRTPFSWMTLANPREVTVVAPGHHAFTTLRADPRIAESSYGIPPGGGASLPCALASGLASLMWSASPWLTPGQIKSCLARSCVTLTAESGATYGRIDALAALEAVWAGVTVLTPNLAFVDVPVGGECVQDIELMASGCAPLAFTVVAPDGLDAAFSVEGETMNYVPGTPGAVSGVSVRYRAGTAGSIATGFVTLKLDRSDREWVVHLSANTVPIRSMAVALVADTSGSMALPVGVGGISRMDLVRRTLNLAVSIMQPRCLCALVRFDTDAHVEIGLTEMANGGDGDQGRMAIKRKIAELTPGGDTSIGDGVLLGNHVVSAAEVPGALLVVTDGCENAPRMIADVMDEITSRVYALAIGSPSLLQPDALARLTAATGGYLLVTEMPQNVNQSRLGKYFVQMLADFVGDSVIVDPAAYVRPDASIEVPFSVTGQDRHCDVILMLPGMNAATLHLVAPGGERIAPEEAPKGCDYRSDDSMALWRLNLSGAGMKLRPGSWRAVMSVDGEQFEKFVASAPDRDKPALRAHGIPCNLLITARSSLTMEARSLARGFAPGSEVRVRAVLRDGRRVLARPATVSAGIEAPDGTRTEVKLRRISAGVFEHAFTAEMEGVYTSTVRASGHNARLEHYTREQVVTTPIWVEQRTTG